MITATAAGCGINRLITEITEIFAFKFSVSYDIINMFMFAALQAARLTNIIGKDMKCYVYDASKYLRIVERRYGYIISVSFIRL